MQEGVKFEGLKLVAGRTTMVLKDPDKLVELLEKEGVEPTLLYKPKELCSKTELQRIVGKKRFDELTSDLYESKQERQQSTSQKVKKKNGNQAGTLAMWT